MRNYMKTFKIIPFLILACIGATAPDYPTEPSIPNGPEVGIVSITHNANATTTVVFGLTWGAPSFQAGQAPVTGYRTYIMHGLLTGVADTLAERTVGNVLADSITVTITTDTLSAITGVMRTIDTQGRVSGIAGSAPISFNTFPTGPTPPTNPTIRQVSP